MKRKLLSILCSLLTLAMPVAAQEHLIMQFDFSKAEGSNVKDNISGITAKAMSGASIAWFGECGVLNLGNSTGYLDMTSAAGNVLKACDNYTVSVYYRVDSETSLSGNGYFLWSFATSSATSATSGKYSAYRLNAQRFAASTGGYNNEKGIQTGTASEKGRWIHVAYTEQDGSGKLYIDGKQVAVGSSMLKNTTNFGTATINYCWIGRAPFSGDNYLKRTLVADFRLYDTALSLNEVKELAAKTADMEDAMMNGGGGDNTALLSTIAEAQALSSEGYPAGAVTTLQDMITVCQNIAAADRSQLIYDQYNSQLKSAISTYKTRQNKTFDPSGTDDPTLYNTDRGFLHPGMLHTEADFERIRQQLADGNSTVTQAYNVLKSADYAQSTAATYPVETIVRGGGSGENYINAARGATIAYQNALRWRIEGNELCARHAVDVLMAWAKTCKYVSGNSNYALAAGLYGYQFANAAELVRDYEGWSAEDFQTFKQWMLDVWYTRAIGFLRGRNGTWENAGKWGECPGHYWSNWGLCNALCVACIGILCDDVFLYNQGMSFFKYDQVGTFVDPRTANPILNDGLTEFLGNLVVTTAEWSGETGAYGRVGQMQESGRDIGHATMALGLAVDLAHVGWNQGDDLFAYMDHRLAAGIEFVAAQQKGVADLPWTNYHYADNGIAWWDNRSWLQTGYATGEQIRPYWGTVIGHYEGVKGVKMPMAEWAYSKMGIDGGGLGGTSGGYDHLGYSVLMNTRPFATEETIPTELKPQIEVDGQTLQQADLGGLKNHWRNSGTQTVEPGTAMVLTALLPDGEEDTGEWLWNTGETSRSISITAYRSYVYRVCYTNRKGVKSYQSFAIAVTGDCMPSALNTSLTVGDTSDNSISQTLFYGEKATVFASTYAGWDSTVWDDGSNTASTEIPALASKRTVQAIVTNQGGRKQLLTYQLEPIYAQANIILNGETIENLNTLVLSDTDFAVLKPFIPMAMGAVEYLWGDGSSENSLSLSNIATSGIYSVKIKNESVETTVKYNLYLPDNSTKTPLESGYYMIRHVSSNTYLTDNGVGEAVSFTEGDSSNPQAEQIWELTAGTSKYAFKEVGMASGLGTNGNVISRALSSFIIEKAIGMDRYALSTKVGSTSKYWGRDTDCAINTNIGGTLADYPFEFIYIQPATGIQTLHAEENTPAPTAIYDLTGRRLTSIPSKGIYIRNGKKIIIR